MSDCMPCEESLAEYSPLTIYLIKSGGDILIYLKNNGPNIIVIKRLVLYREWSEGGRTINYLRGSDFIIGGEESGGLTIRKHIPEKDGVLACLLIAEMVAEERKSIKDIIQDIERQVGRYTSKRVNFHLSQENMDRFKQKLQGKPPPDISGNKIKKIVTIDGFKFILEDNSWIGIRLSGTEPVVRLYVETSSEEKLQSLISAGERFVKGNLGDTSLN